MVTNKQTDTGSFCSIEMYESDVGDVHQKCSTGAIVLLNSSTSSNHMVCVLYRKILENYLASDHNAHHESFMQIPVSRPDSQLSLETLPPEGNH